MDPATLSILIGGGIALANGAGQAIGSANASAAQKASAEDALSFQREMWQQQRADQAPWLAAGKTSLAEMLRMMSSPAAITASPSYQFRLAEGQKALERSAAARGGLGSGRFMKDLTRFGQGTASDEYTNQWNRLAGLANVGQTSAQSLGSLGANYGNQATNLYGAIGNAGAAGHVGMANGFTNALEQVGGLAMNLPKAYQATLPSAAPTLPTQVGAMQAGRGFNPYR
jgi:hypothetical protein